MVSQYQRPAPLGHPFLSSAPADHKPVELPTSWASLLQFITLIEQNTRRIAHEEFSYLLAEHATAAAEVEKNDQLITVAQAAVILDVIPQTVYEWIKAGKLKSFTIGRNRIRLKRGDALAALQAQTQANGRRKYARRGKEVRRG
ncbi:MAG: DNA-binding protein [Hymenobacter sp.]|nr:MAG: DNA-binding protein [Hymenobacter sp.]